METVAERDPREDEEWFGRLPPAVQTRFRAAWARDRDAVSADAAKTRRRVRRCARDSAILMPALALLVNLFQLPSFFATLGLLATAAIAGAAVGALLGAGTHGRFRAGMLGMAAFVPLQLSVASIGGGGMLALICFFYGALLVMCSYGVFGLCMEVRARPGSGME